MQSDWQCPYCGLETDISSVKAQRAVVTLEGVNDVTPRALVIEAAVCPNTYCRETQAHVGMYNIADGKVQTGDPPSKSWPLIPSFAGRGIPEYVPEGVRTEYEQACAIREASPNAAATLARRCLQAMIQDFWGIRESFLSNAIDALKEKMDEETFEAIDAVRNSGKLRQHMEKGTNLIHDSAPEDAELLIGLIEYLIEEWYVTRDKRKQRLKRIKELPPKVSDAPRAVMSRAPPPQMSEAPGPTISRGPPPPPKVSEAPSPTISRGPPPPPKD